MFWTVTEFGKSERLRVLDWGGQKMVRRTQYRREVKGHGRATVAKV